MAQENYLMARKRRNLALLISTVQNATKQYGFAQISFLKAEFFDKLGVAPSLMDKYIKELIETEKLEELANNKIKAIGFEKEAVEVLKKETEKENIEDKPTDDDTGENDG